MLKEVNALLIQDDGRLVEITLMRDGDFYVNRAGVRYVVDRRLKTVLTQSGELNGEAVGLVNPIWPTPTPVFWLPLKQFK
jgi:hypothetical protein